jgi:hypothetical protein
MWYQERVCPWCGQSVPESAGVVCWSYRTVLHQGKCLDLAQCLERDFSSSSKGRLRRASELRQRVVEVRGKPPGQWIDFNVLAHLEPQLRELLRRAQAYHRVQDQGLYFCANEAWYGYGAHTERGLKQALLKLVGHERERRHTVLSSPFAYDLAYDTIYDALLLCRGRCSCLG